MKKAIVIVALVALALTVMGCSTVNRPALLGDGTVGPRTGQASGQLIFGSIGTVDAGMITAARNAGITRIGAVDFEVKNLLGIIVTYTTTVTGQ
jgi:hypothetical protein